MAGRVRLDALIVMGFVVLLVACSGIAIAATPDSADPVVVSPAQQDEVLTEAEDEEAREREEAEEALSTPAAVAERAASQLLYAGLTPAEQVQLLRERFAPQLEAVDADPSRALADVTLKHLVSPTEALVTLEGESALLESNVPLRARENDGDLAKVDLGLEETDRGYAPANPLVDISFPKSAAEPIHLGSDGLTITAEGARESAAVPLGEEDLLLPHVAEDTSLLLSPISGGFHLSALLLSRKSAEQLGFSVSLPEGAELRAAGDGGAEVIDAKGKRLVSISAPRAIDAQGTSVPVSLVVKGNSLLLEIAHREMDVAYPLFLDPEVIEENWWGFPDTSKLNYWNWQWGGVPSSETYIGQRSCIVTCWGNGLYVRSRSNTSYPAGSYGRWWFAPQGSTTYMRRVILGPMNYDAHGCTANEPHPFVGIWNNGGFWSVLNNAYPTGWLTWIDSGAGNNLGAGARTAFLGISATSAANIKCGHDYFMGGAVLYLDDPELPTLGAPSGYPTGWAKDDQPFTINVPVSDPGLGALSATLSPTGATQITKKHGCTGHYNSQCPANHTFAFAVTADSFDEGEETVKASAKDAIEKTSLSKEFTLKVDRTPPEVLLGGQLAVATDETEGDGKDTTGTDALTLPVYNLKIEATDGSNASAATKRSGVKSIEVFLDGKGTPEKAWTQPGPCDSCPMTQTYALKLNELSATTEHTLRVVTKDLAGNAPREREIEFEYIPATGMKEEYVLHYFPLPNGQGNEGEEEDPIRPELAVNVTNGNLVYRQLDVEVSGPAADLEVERYYNSLLPDSEDTEWGEGWTLGQTPELEPRAGEGSPTTARLLQRSGAVQNVGLPTEPEAEKFDPRLRAVVTMEPGGGYEIADRSGDTDTSQVFDENGKLTQLHTSGYAGIDYSYEGGDLAEIAVEDPAGFGGGQPMEIPDPVPPTYAASFGTTGSGNGQLETPADVAMDADGNLWVADKGNHRIQKFSASGAFLSQFGTQGSADGQLTSPSSLTIDAAGNIWVTDQGNHRVQKFSPSGQFLAKFGSLGTGNGKFLGPNGIAIDESGAIWVCDAVKVERFTPQGQFIERVGTAGSGPGQLSGPNSLDVDPEGNVLVAEATNDRVSVFDGDGDFLRTIGSAGTGPGQFANPAEVNVDPYGNVWVADNQANRVQLFNLDGDYLATFGGPGAGIGQFSLDLSAGLLADGSGRIWVSDPGHDRVQRWRVPPYTPTYAASFGEEGEGEGEFDHPADIAIDSAGDLWVLDTYNYRVQHFDPEGDYLGSFGTLGSANGQLYAPTAIAIDPQDNLWVADTGNDRIQKFNPAGQYLAKFGTAGSAEGNLEAPEGLAIDPKGNIWVADTGNNRVQKFSAAGAFIKAIGLSGPGDLHEPLSIDVSAEGEVFIADSGHDRVAVFDEAGEFLRGFGAIGYGNGQFRTSDGLEVDAQGNVWVGDERNERVELFDSEGNYVTQFGREGDGEAEMELAAPVGIAADADGSVWVTDSGNERMQRWENPGWEQTEIPGLEDPAVEVNVDGGLVEAVEGEEAGETTYEHEGELLTAVSGVEGETEYDYDGADRLTKVTLANGTYAEVAYEPTYGRVKSVTVAPEGANAKTTHFSYQDEPRRTTVTPPDAPITTYDIAADGSVLKWWNTEKPPEFDDLAGTLYDNRETAQPIGGGLYNLKVQAHSEEGIASIEVIANNNLLVSEKTCEQDPETPGVECVTEEDEWVTETANWPPGIVYLEVLITDRLGNSASERFWVNIPYTPPPDPEVEEAPKFADILKFREDFGLDLDLKGNEEAVNDRVFNLIGDWNNPHTPEGEVARATDASWSVPLRPIDAAEMQFREGYVAQAAAVIPQWAIANGARPAYAGYYVDHRQGGLIYVGFIGSQQERIDALQQTGILTAPNRIRPFPVTPTSSLDYLETLEAEVVDAATTLSGVTGIQINVQQNRVDVGALDVVQTRNAFEAQFGSQEPINVYYQPQTSQFLGSPWGRPTGAVKAAERIWDRGTGFVACSAGFGAWDRGGIKPDGTPLYRHFILTAGHCYVHGELVYQFDAPGEDPEDWWERDLGYVRRNAMIEHPSGYGTDALAIRVADPGIVPRLIRWSSSRDVRVQGVAVPKEGMVVCVAGSTRGHSKCGAMDWPPETKRWEPVHNNGNPILTTVPFKINSKEGDSGGPIWERSTGYVLGTLTGGTENEASSNFTPLESLPGYPSAPGTLQALEAGGEHLHVVLWKP